MSGDFFRALFREKNIHKKGTELYLKLVESVKEAPENYIRAVKKWREKEYDTAYKLRDRTIQMEKDADKVKEVFFENIFRRKAYLPNITEERHKMTLNTDKLLDTVEQAFRTLCLKKLDEKYFPSEFKEILKKTDKVIESFVKANVYFFKDFEKSTKHCHKIEKLRDEVRDLYFEILGQIMNEKVPKDMKWLLDATVQISFQAEEASDYLMVLIAKHS
ncbi:MAG: DUF47 family protein [Candidatus Hermodarchaeota archaeon]